MATDFLAVCETKLGWRPGDLYNGLGDPPKPELEPLFRERRTQRLAAINTVLKELASKGHDDASIIALGQRMKWVFADARPKQLWPGPQVAYYALLGGRRAGKNAAASRRISNWAQNYPGSRWGCVGPTRGKVKSVMFEGQTGLLAILPHTAMWGGTPEKAFNKTTLQLRLSNDATITGFSAKEPGSIRGEEFWGIWGDELGEWSDSNQLPMEKGTTFSNMLLANSGGKPHGWSPKGIFTMTPVPVKLLAGERDDKSKPGLLTGYGKEIGLTVQRMSTRDNLYNLPKQYKLLVASLEGTRIGRQEIDAELLTDVEGALWQSGWITHNSEIPETGWIAHAVGLDHAVTANEHSDETGIVVVGLHSAGFYWVLEDHSGKYSPAGWSQIVADISRRYPGIKVITEPNQGGDLISQSLSIAGVPKSSIEPDRAYRSKLERFEPVRLLYQALPDWPDGRVIHGSRFPLLEDQMTLFTGSAADSDDRIDGLAAAIRWLSQKDDHSMHGKLDLSGLGLRPTWY